MNIKSLNTLLIAASVLSFAACNKENGLEQAHQDRNLSFELSMAAVSHDTDESGASTKSMEIKSADGSITLPMEYRVTDGIGESPLAGEAQTKGEQINSETEMLDQNIVSFKVKAWNSDNSQFLPREGSGESTVKYTNGKWTLDVETAPLWKNADTKTFFAYANLPDGATVSCTNDDDHSFHTFSYSSLQTDATAQKDALLGYYKGNGGLGGVAKIQFIHPLTAVVFKQGVFVGDFTIKSLSLEGVYKGGVANVTYAYDDTYGDIVPTFDWGTSRSETITVSQNIPDPGTPPGSGNKIGQSFILIPQNLAEKNVIIKAIVTTTDGDQEIMANLDTGEWMAGKTNTYTLNYDSHTYTYEITSDINTTTFLTNTEESQDVTINSKKTNELGEDSPIGWFIKSVQVGAGEIEEINSTSFTNRGGISASQTNDSKLSITAEARTDVVYPGTHGYWTGGNGNWSPEDWTNATATSPLDLSKFNFQDETTDNPMTTANCYIIRHAGTYKLPLVYGNAVVKGSPNEQSYLPNATGGSNRLERFVNSRGVGITSPFIENADYCGGSDLKCAVIWQDKAEVVKSLQIVGNIADSYTISNVRYLQFSISQGDICQNNALICVYKDKEGGTAGQYDTGEAVWSWHIWTTNDPALLSPAIPVFNFPEDKSESKKYDFFPLNCLGWTDNTDITKPTTCPSKEDVKIVLAQNDSDSDEEIILTVKQNSVYMGSVSCYYQWGRKDPMCPTDSPIGSFKVHDKNTKATLADAICNPDRIYYTSNKNNWCKQMYNNLWTGKKSETGLFDQDSDMIKTIYDPSPVGYKMPASKAFTGFSTTGGTVEKNISKWNIYGGFNNGGNFYTKPDKKGDYIFFPCPALRGESGTVDTQQIGQQGYYWSAVPNNENTGQNLTIWSDGTLCVPSTSNGLSVAFSVRPVLE